MPELNKYQRKAFHTLLFTSVLAYKSSSLVITYLLQVLVGSTCLELPVLPRSLPVLPLDEYMQYISFLTATKMKLSIFTDL